MKNTVILFTFVLMSFGTPCTMRAEDPVIMRALLGAAAVGLASVGASGYLIDRLPKDSSPFTVMGLGMASLVLTHYLYMNTFKYLVTGQSPAWLPWNWSIFSRSPQKNNKKVLPQQETKDAMKAPWVHIKEEK